MRSEEIDWRRYIRGECCPEQAERLEHLLLTDEAALEQYMNTLNVEGNTLPGLLEPEAFTQKIIQALPSVIAGEEARKVRWFEQRMFHYAVAACLTLIFLSAGWFDRLTDLTTDASLSTVKSMPVSETLGQQFIQITTSWLDVLKPSR